MKPHLPPSIACGLLLILCIASLVSAREVDVYLFGGQSNMQGIARIADLPANVPTEHPHVRFWNGRDFEPFVIGKTKSSSREGEFGPELGFALGMEETEKQVYLIKYAASGMPLHYGWNGNTWSGGAPEPGRRNFHPGDSADDPNQGTLYRAMLATFRAGLESLRQKGGTPVVRGFLWMQGEQDSKNETSATTYAASLRRLRDRIASDLDAGAELPMAFGQVLPHEPALERFTHRREVREQMGAADADSGRPEAIPGVHLISTDGFGLLPDRVHYDTDGQLRLGKAFAAAMTAPRTPRPLSTPSANSARPPQKLFRP
jgi:hypothetical protein